MFFFWTYAHFPPICHCSTSSHSLCCTRFSPLNFPGRRVSFHMYVSPILWPPPIVPVHASLAILDLISISLPDPGILCRVPVTAVSLMRSPFLCRPRPVPRLVSAPSSFPFQVYLPPADILCRPHIPPASPPIVLDRRPIPLPVPRGLCCGLRLPFPCSFALSSLLLHHLLVSSSYWFLCWVSYVMR